MKKNSLIISFFAFLCLAVASLYSQGQEPRDVDSITFIQKDKVWIVKNISDSIHLERDSFCIRFSVRKHNEKKKLLYAMQVAAVTEDSSIKFMTVGEKTQSIPYFSLGTGLAAEEFGYFNLFVNNEAFHYIYYENEQERRAKLLSEKKGIIELEWCIPQAFYEGEDISFTKLSFKRIYLVFFNDKNLNEVVDEGEFKIIFLNFD